MTDADAQEGQRATPDKSAALSIVGLLIAGVIVFAVFSGMGDDADPDEVNSWDAERVCKDDFIAKRLKAPSTAKYDLTTTGGPATYTVSGTVDAENSFGAALRSNVTCVVTIQGDRWRLDSLTGLE